MQDNIFLIGFMGAGKSTIASTLKRCYGMQLIEMDEQIEKQEGMRITQIFEKYGEDYFRCRETELLEKLQQRKNTVVSCGGGVPMRECNIEAMQKSGRIIYLSARPETIYQRVRNNHGRPLLEGNMNVGYISSLLEQRMPRYLAAADATVQTDGRTAEEICREIMEICD